MSEEVRMSSLDGQTQDYQDEVKAAAELTRVELGRLAMAVEVDCSPLLMNVLTVSSTVDDS